jgi:hypothetical protein
MSIFRASINLATATRTLDELNEHLGAAATRWSGIGDPIHEFDLEGPVREISQWHLDSSATGETQLLEQHLAVLRPALTRLADAPLEGVLYSSFSIGVTGRENGFVFEIEPVDAALIARARLHLRIDAYPPAA